uniref:Uncharacterized protein n=1 Tax=Panagrolaimus sp. JU765 TaxID=591449 RepID=A0AC34RGY9_9BILA
MPEFDNKLMLADIYAAAESANLKILDIITETHADLLYFLSNEEFSKEETVAIVDVGGGTGFIEKFNFENGLHEKRDLLFFCGREINERLERALQNLFYERFKLWPTFDLKQKSEIEKIKEDLSFEEE